MTNKPTRWILVRLVLIAILFLSIMTGMGWKAYKLQVEKGPQLKALAEQQYLKKLRLPPSRGTIYDRNSTPIAVSVDVDSVSANPRQVGNNWPQVSKSLAMALNLNPRKVAKKLKSKRYFIWLKRRIKPSESKAVRKLLTENKLRGINLIQESKRYYPHNKLAASILGYAGIDAHGLAGLEFSYNSILRGKRQRFVGLRDALGRPLLSKAEHHEAVRGKELVLALDKYIQYETEKAIRQAFPIVKRNEGWISVVVMNPKNGDILAMANMPNFDPNKYSKSKPKERRNRSVTDLFEPGSTIKPITVAGAMNHNVLKASEVFNCENGRFKVGRHTIHDSKPYKKLSVAKILSKSSNIGVSKIALRLGKKRLHKVLRDFGFGKRTGAGFPGERDGILRNPKRWSNIGLANISFGQGIATTALQVVRAFSALGNGGLLMEPRLVLQVKDAHGNTLKKFNPKGKRILKKYVADSVLKMLIGTTLEGGTAVKAALDNYSVAGKTGTAQKVDPITGRYTNDRWLASFIGLVPASNPQLVIGVTVNEPEGKKYHGGDVAAPIFNSIASKSLRYLGVSPDIKQPLKTELIQTASRSKTKTLTTFKPKAPPLPGHRPEKKYIMPNFIGMSLVKAMQTAKKQGVLLNIQGSGKAVKQKPEPGSTTSNKTCSIVFEK